MAATALITGASGLIGRAVLAHWTDPHGTPVALDHSRDDLLEPGTAKAVLDRLRPEVVVHLAWVASGTHDYRSSPDNGRWLEASLELAQACTDSGALLFATGTALDRDPTGADAYSGSKRLLWQALSSAVGAGSLGWLRPFYVVDPLRQRPALVAQALQARAEGRPLVLATPDSRHDFVHVDDVGAAIALAVAHRLTGEVEIGAGRLRTVRALVEALGVTWEAGPPPPHTPHVHAPARIERLLGLGWAPTTTEELFPGD